MKKTWIFGTLIVFACNKPNEMPPDPGAGTSKPVVKVMTYNIYGARASSGAPADLALLAKVIDEEKPDLVALQEVDVFTRRTGTTVHQARDLAALTGMEWHFVKAIDQTGGEYGDAVLSRLPIHSKQGFMLPVTPQLSGEFRSVALIQVEKEGKKFYFASTHFDHLAQEDNRLLQAQELKKIVAGIGGPLIVAGDLNARPESQTMTIVHSYLNSGCMQQCPRTFPSDNPDRTIDYILSAPAGKFSVVNYRALTGYLSGEKKYASDHCAVIASYKLNW